MPPKKRSRFRTVEPPVRPPPSPALPFPAPASTAAAAAAAAAACSRPSVSPRATADPAAEDAAAGLSALTDSALLLPVIAPAPVLAPGARLATAPAAAVAGGPEKPMNTHTSHMIKPVYAQQMGANTDEEGLGELISRDIDDKRLQTPIYMNTEEKTP